MTKLKKIVMRIAVITTLLIHVNTGFCVPESASDICPILVGEAIPEINIKTPDGAPFNLNKAIAAKPTLVIFYRGGWCPFCTMHLGALQKIVPELAAAGVQILAISPDRPEIVSRPQTKQNLGYKLLSDNDAMAAMALGIAFKVDDKTVNLYKTEYSIDLEADSGRQHHILPVPAAFLIGTDGVVSYSYINPNYKVRANPDLILAAARLLVKQQVDPGK